jgi:hypothetical protein
MPCEECPGTGITEMGQICPVCGTKLERFPPVLHIASRRQPQPPHPKLDLTEINNNRLHEDNGIIII